MPEAAQTSRKAEPVLRASLAGLKVVDFTQIGAGPTCTMMLADLGAQVVKVEPPGGEIGRKLGPPWYGDESPIFIAFNRGKSSICLNLRDKAGREKALALCLDADVVVESFRPGVMSRLGLGPEHLREAKPSLIYCSVSGFGQTGPMAQNAGVDGILQAASGLMSLIGNDEGEPCKVQAPIVDVTTGYIASIGILARLAARHEPGFVGGHLDVNLLSCAVALQQSAITSYLGSDELPTKIGSAAPYSAPNEAFQTMDGWIMVAAYMGDRWQRLCRLLDLPELESDARFRDSSLRVVNRPAMRQALAPAFKSRSTQDWLAVLEENDILCSKVCNYDDLLKSEQIKHLGMITEMKRSEDGRVFKMPALPINTREAAEAGYSAPPRLK